MNETADRRLFPRIHPTHVTVEIFSPDGYPATCEFCPIRNLSQSGMMFESGKKYKKDAMIGLTFVLPGDNIVIRSDARIAHARRSKGSSQVGVEFKNMTSESRSLIGGYVSAVLDNK